MRLLVIVFSALLLAGCASTGDKMSSGARTDKSTLDTTKKEKVLTYKQKIERERDEIFEAGVKNYLIGDYKTSIENLQKAADTFYIERGCDFPAASCYYLGRIYAELATDFDGVLGRYQLFLKSFEDDENMILDFENPFPEDNNYVESAKEYLKKAAYWEPDEIRYKKTYLYFLLNGMRDTTAADSVAKEILIRQKTEYNYMQVINLTKKQEEQMSYYEEMEKTFGPSQETNMWIYQYYKEHGDISKAIDALKRLAENTKTNDATESNFNRILYARQLLDMEKSKKKEALNIAQDVLHEYPDDESASIFMVYYYNITGNTSEMYEAIKKVINSPTISNGGKYNTLSEMLDGFRAEKEEGEITLADRPEMIEVMRMALSLSNVNNDIVLLCEKMTEDENDLSETTEPLFYEILKHSPENIPLREMLINYYLNTNNTARCVELCEEGIKYMEPASIFYLYEGQSYWQQQRYEEMFSALDKGIKSANEPEEQEVLSKLYNLYGLGCYRVDPPNTKANYEKALEYDSANIECLKNYCCYIIDYWDGSMRDKLLALSRRALDIDVSDMEVNTYYAMALMLNGQADEAKARIDAVLSDYDIDEVYDIVLEYAGDIYKSVGLNQEARNFWERAASITTDEDMKARINQKIEEL